MSYTWLPGALDIRVELPATSDRLTLCTYTFTAHEEGKTEKSIKYVKFVQPSQCLAKSKKTESISW